MFHEKAKDKNVHHITRHMVNLIINMSEQRLKEGVY